MVNTAGRPKNKNQTKPLKAKAWFYYVAARLHLKRTGYALENYLEPEKVRRNDDGTVTRPCKYDGYKKGLHIPDPDLVDEVDLIAPGSKSLLYHPFWEVANPIQDITELYIHLNKLSSGIVELLFHPGTEPGKVPQRHRKDYLATLDALSKKADLDAFTACIGLLQEANLTREPILHVFYMKPTLAAFRRLIYYPPFPDIAHELFEYLTNTFFTKLNGKEVDKLVSEVNVDRAIFYSHSLLSIVDDLGILRKFTFPPVSCMHIIERYMTTRAYTTFLADESDKDWVAYKKLPEIRNLTRSLRRWESKQSNFSTLPWS
ncbi:MAG: hypothetical protein ABW090_03280 [Sedimenticola sp.]